MVYLLIALSVILIFLLALLFSKIKIFFEYKKMPGEKIYTGLQISVGFIKLNLKPKVKKAKHEKEKSDEGIIQKIKTFKKTFVIARKVYSKNRWHIRKSLKVENIDFHIKFGLNDAASTGIATGAIWSLLYSITAFVAQVGSLKKHYFEVVPVYTEPGLIVQGSFRLSIRVISAISIAARLYLTYKNVIKEENNK